MFLSQKTFFETSVPTLIVEIFLRLPLKGSQKQVCPKPHASTYRTYILRLGEVLSDDLSGLRRDPVWEVDGKLHDEVAAL